MTETATHSPHRRRVLRNIMRTRGLTSRQVAKLVERSQSTVLHWMSGDRPTPAWAIKLLMLQ